MKTKMLDIPRLSLVEWLGKNEVRLFFSSGKIVETQLPWVKVARDAKIIDRGMGLDPGNGRDVSALALAEMKGKVLKEGRRGWIGSPKLSTNKKRCRK